MIRVEHLTKSFGGRRVLDALTFEVGAGEIVGFLGPNGAGKTTTLRILACYLPPTGGRATVAGLDVLRDSLEVRRRIGYMPENVPLYPDMRVHEYLRHRGALKGMSGRRIRQRLDEVVDLCSLGEAYDRIIGQLSKGYRQRVGLADALIHEPDVLLLDEPTIGLDPNQIRQFRGLIRGLAGRHTVLLSSHILPEVENVCSRVLIMNRGRITASDAPDSLIEYMKGCVRVVAEVNGPVEQVRELVEALAPVRGLSILPNGGWLRLCCEVERGADIREDIFRLARDNRWMLRELLVESMNLEDAFVEATGEARQA